MRTDRQTAVVAGLATIGLVAVAFGSLIGPEWTPKRPESAGELGDAISLGGLSLMLGACVAYWATAPHRDLRGSASRRRFARAAAMAPLDASGGSSASDGFSVSGAFSSAGSSVGSDSSGTTEGPDSPSQPPHAVGELAVMPEPGRRSTPDRRKVSDRRSAKDRRATRRSTPDRRAYSVLYSDADPYPDPLPHGRVEPSAASTNAAATAVKQALAAAAAIAQAAGAPGTTPIGPQSKADADADAKANGDAYSGANSGADTEAPSPLAGLEEYAKAASQAGQPADTQADTPADTPADPPNDPPAAATGSGTKRRRSNESSSLLRRARSLDRVGRDARVGQAAENYVGAIVKRVGRASYDVKKGTVLGPPEISFHHGDIDFLLVGRDGALSFLLEVKATNPERRGGAEGEKHAAQAARGRRAVLELTNGAVNPIPIVVYVDPIDTGADTLKLRPLESSETHAGVWSVGAKGLESALRSLVQEFARSQQ